MAIAIGLTSSAAMANTLEARAAKMHLRVLTYDRNMATRGGKDTVILGVVYDPQNKASEQAARTMGGAFVQAAGEAKLNDRQVNVVLVPWSGDEMGTALSSQNVAILFVASGTWNVVEAVKQTASTYRIPTLSGSRTMVEAGIGVGVLASDQGIRILINRKAAAANGMDLDARVYKSAELVGNRSQRPGNK